MTASLSAAAVAVKENKAEKDKKLKVFKIQRTCVHDGPGIRTTIFFRVAV